MDFLLTRSGLISHSARTNKQSVILCIVHCAVFLYAGTLKVFTKSFNAYPLTVVLFPQCLARFRKAPARGLCILARRADQAIL